MRRYAIGRISALLCAALSAAPSWAVQNLTETFDDITTLPGEGWSTQNLSSPTGTYSWFQGNVAVFNAYDGAADAYIAANFNSTSGSTGTISNWLITPTLDFGNGATFSFFTRKEPVDSYPDRLEVRLSTNGASTDAGTTATSTGDFTTLELSINPNLVTGVYPTTWTQYTITGLPHNGQGRIALRYFVTNAGPTGVDSDYIGIDHVEYSAGSPEYQVGGSVSGLVGSGLTLQLNGANDLPITADGTFTFPSYFTAGSDFTVTVSAQPTSSNQTCQVTNGSGTMGAADVNDVAVQCTTPQYTVGGTVNNLLGLGLQLELAGVATVTLPGGGNTFSFPPIDDGSAWSIAVVNQPHSPNQTCDFQTGTNSGTISGSDVNGVVVNCTTTQYTVGGTINGLSGTGLQLQLSAGASTTVVEPASFASSFVFPAIDDGTSWTVSVVGQPGSPVQTCDVTNASGALAGADVTDVAVNCITKFTVSGKINSLSGSNLQLQINGGDVQTISAGATSFAFAPLPDGTAWTVTVANQPNTPSQTCSVTNGSGTLAGADVTNVAVNCTTKKFTVGGSISSLSGSNLQLQINGGDTQTLAAGATSFAFASLPDGTAWTVTVATQPDTPSQTCTVTNGSGTLASANVNDVSVNCTTNKYTVGGSVGGLNGTVTLQLNGTNDLAVSSNGFTFPAALDSGSSYLVTVGQQPSGQNCSVSNASGTVTNANINNIAVSCINWQSQLSLAIDDGHGYARYGQVLDYVITLTNNGNAPANNVSISSNGTSLDMENATWQCSGGTSGAVCAASGSGALSDTVTLPSGRSVQWVYSVPVANTQAFIVGLEVNATGAQSVADFDTPVIFRDGFGVSDADTASAPTTPGAEILSGEASVAFTLPAPHGNRIDTVQILRDGGVEVRVERIALAGSEYVRLLQHPASGAEHASAWALAEHNSRLVIDSVAGMNGERIVLLEGAYQPLELSVNH